MRANLHIILLGLCSACGAAELDLRVRHFSAAGGVGRLELAVVGVDALGAPGRGVVEVEASGGEVAAPAVTLDADGLARLDVTCPAPDEVCGESVAVTVRWQGRFATVAGPFRRAP
ncbi:MAG: hypothetical protein IAE78_05235, partial [Myxococcus sp.]|nr:hypothetical protein [Myxococcus sp.]